MKIKLMVVGALAMMLILMSQAAFGRGGRGGGGGGFGGGGRGGGGFSGGGFSGGGRVGPVGGYGGGYGGHVGARTSTPVVGPRGGTGQVGHGGGSYTTQRGSTVNYGGAAAGGTGARGGQAARAVGGVNVTTPGGREVSRVGTGGAAVGPGGNAVAGRSGATVGSGPQGAMASRYQGGVAIGPQGAAAGRAGGAVAAGPGGAGAVAGRGAVAHGAYGAAAGRAGAVAGAGGAAVGRAGAVAGRSGTYYRSGAAVRTQGVAVRHGVAGYQCFRPGWYARYPGAWFAAGWTAAAVWRAATWPAYSSFCGYSGGAPYYNYGDNVVVQEDQIYIDGAPAYTTQDYAQQASDLAASGRSAPATKEEEWMPLGVFAMVQGEETTSNHIFQLAVNKQGVIRGNYYDAVTDTTSTVSGKVDKETQRAAWTVGDRTTPVYEAGIANLTKDETTMLVHYGSERSQQYTLIRIEDPDKATPTAPDKAAPTTPPGG